MHCSLETADFYTPDICKNISPNFFRPYFHCCLLSSVHYCRDLSHIHFFICSSHIWFLYICSHLFITQQVYLESTLWSASSWLVSLVGRHCIGITEVMGSYSIQAWIFSFRSCFTTGYLGSVSYCKDHFHIHPFVCCSNIRFSCIHSHLLYL